MFTAASCQSSHASWYNPKLNLFFTPCHFPNQWTDLLASSWTQNSGYTVKLFSIVPLSELLLRVETVWQMWNETIILQIVLPWGFGFYLFTSCTLYHLNQPPKDSYYVLLIFWVLNLKKCWKLIASVRIKEDLCLEEIKCCVIKNPLNYQAQCMTAIEPKIRKHILCLLFSTSVSHLNLTMKTGDCKDDE